MIPSDIKLYTWVDVQELMTRALEENLWPEWLTDARVYWDSLTLRVKTNTSSQALEWLKNQFDPRINLRETEHACILLESDETERTLPIYIEETSETAELPKLVPTMERPRTLTSQIKETLRPIGDPKAPDIVAFHSFKGGVGRTLHAFTLAVALADRKTRVLLIDADFEAPGISWMLSKRLPSPPVSFSDYLAIAHSEPDSDGEAAARLVAARLRDSYISGVYVMPAFRSNAAFQRLEIRPEHILQGNRNEFIITSMLYQLAEHLDVKVVVVDLRAGLSELSAGLLLDPRVQRVLVSSGSAQSISGTEVVLDLIAKHAPSSLEEHPIPYVILNQVPESARSNLAREEERLITALSKTVTRDFDPDPLQLDLSGPSWFDAGLITLPSDWDDVALAVMKTSVANTIGGIVKSLSVSPGVDNQASGRQHEEQRVSLRDTAERFIVAETSEGSDFLPIAPLRRLVEDHSTVLPNIVVVGAKGAGKTYTYLQALRRSGWKDFATATGAGRETTDALLFPVLQPQNLRSAVWLRNKAVQVSEQCGLATSLDQFAISDLIQGWLNSGLHQGQWRERWLDLIAWSVGYELLVEGAGRRFSEFLRSSEKRLVCLFDGLEDMFQDVTTDERQQTALRALLQDVPNWLEQSPESRIGMLLFIRRDLVSAAIRQNAGQLIARYEPYALKWNGTEALRLVGWIAAKAGVSMNAKRENLPELDQEDLIEALLPLWGRKLGNDQSREGRSAEWVVAALSDFRGQLQARDIVRLLKLAAAQSVNTTAWLDRVLTPQSIRESVTECSTEKIREISEENVPLKKVFESLQQLPYDKKAIPFSAEEVGLTASDVLLLEANGVVVSYEREFFMPEIYRRGLDFRLPQGARPRVLALARQRQGKA